MPLFFPTGPIVGTLLPFAGPNPPHPWLKCNGALVSRQEYAELFEVIGVTYGAGDGETTFKLPTLLGSPGVIAPFVIMAFSQ